MRVVRNHSTDCLFDLQLSKLEEIGGVLRLSLQECVGTYTHEIAEHEQIYKDLFGRSEFYEMRKSYFEFTRQYTYLEYMKKEIQRKLEEH